MVSCLNTMMQQQYLLRQKLSCLNSTAREPQLVNIVFKHRRFCGSVCAANVIDDAKGMCETWRAKLDERKLMKYLTCANCEYEIDEVNDVTKFCDTCQRAYEIGKLNA